MLELKINNKEYICYQNWHDVTIASMIELAKVVSEMPKDLELYYDAVITNDEAKTNDQLDLLADKEMDVRKFMKKAISICTNIPANIIDEINHDNLALFYNEKVLKFVLGVIYGDWSGIKEIQSFKFNGEEYHLPKTKLVVGFEKPMADATILEFTEASDLHYYSKGNYKFAKNIVAILCRTKDHEKYTEEKSLIVAEKFNKLTMDIVWEVFFCFLKPKSISNKITDMFFGVRQRLEQLLPKVETQ